MSDITGLTTVDHEYAHAIDAAYTLKVRSDLSDMAVKYATSQPLTYGNIDEINVFNKGLHTAKERMSNVVYERLKLKSGLSNSDFILKVRDELGLYAIQDHNEFLAEGFANARNLSAPSKFVLDFKEIFDEEYNTVLGGTTNATY